MAYFLTRSSFQVWYGLSNVRDKFAEALKDMDAWTKKKLEDLGYSQEEIVDWFWAKRCLHSIVFEKGGRGS